MKKSPLIVAVVAVWVVGAQAQTNSPALAELEARAPKPGAVRLPVTQFMADVNRLVESGTLHTSDQFLRTARLAGLFAGDFRMARVQYELALTAAAMTNRDAEIMLPYAWDALLHTLGRPMRLDVAGFTAKFPDYFTLEPAPGAIQKVWRNPAASRAAAAAAKNNPELQAILKADQDIREKDWSTFTEAETKALDDGDRQRNLRTRKIVAAGAVHTARDFANAALVMQHSKSFAGFELAHELAVCSMLLGDRSFGRQTVTASYDRMLHSVGHDQRFATQMSDDAPTRTDEVGICDAERLALDSQSNARSIPPPRH